MRSSEWRLSTERPYSGGPPQSKPKPRQAQLRVVGGSAQRYGACSGRRGRSRCLGPSADTAGEKNRLPLPLFTHGLQASAESLEFDPEVSHHVLSGRGVLGPILGIRSLQLPLQISQPGLEVAVALGSLLQSPDLDPDVAQGVLRGGGLVAPGLRRADPQPSLQIGQIRLDVAQCSAKPFNILLGERECS